MPIVEQQKSRALIAWLSALGHQGVESVEDLKDGSILLQIANQLEGDTTISSSTVNGGDVEKNWAALLQFLETRYNSFIHSDIQPELILKQADRFELSKVCLLLLTAGVMAANEQFIEAAQKLDVMLQYEIKEMVESVVSRQDWEEEERPATVFDVLTHSLNLAAQITPPQMSSTPQQANSHHPATTATIMHHSQFCTPGAPSRKLALQNRGTPVVFSTSNTSVLGRFMSPRPNSGTPHLPMSPIQQLVSSPSMANRMQLQQKELEIRRLGRQLNTERHMNMELEIDLRDARKEIADKERRIAELQKTNSKFRRQTLDLQTDNDFLQGVKQEKESLEHQVLRKQLESREAREMRDNCKHVERELEEARETICQLRTQLASLSKFREAAEPELATLEQIKVAHAELQQALSEREAAIGQLTSENEVLRFDLLKLKENYHQKCEELRGIAEASMNKEDGGECLAGVIEVMHQEEIDRFKSEVTELKKWLSTKEEKIASQTKELLGLREQKEVLTSQVRSQEWQLEEMRTQFSALQEESTTRVNTLAQEKCALEASVSELRQSLRVSQEKQREASEHVTTLEGKHEILAGELELVTSEAKMATEALESRCEQYRAEIAALQADCNHIPELQSSLETVQYKLTATEREYWARVDELSKSLAALGEEKSDLEVVKTRNAQTIADLNGDVARLKSECEELTELQSNAREENAQLANRLVLLEVAYSQLEAEKERADQSAQQELSEKARLISLAEEKIREQSDVINQLQQRIQMFSQEDIPKLQDELAAKEQRIQEQTNDMEKMAAAHSQAESQLKESSCKLQETSSRLEETLSQLQDRKNQLKETTSQFEDTLTQLKDAQAHIKDSEVEIQNTRSQLNKKESELSNKSEQIKRLQENIAGLEECLKSQEETYSTEKQTVECRMRELSEAKNAVHSELGETQLKCAQLQQMCEQQAQDLAQVKSASEQAKAELERCCEDLRASLKDQQDSSELLKHNIEEQRSNFASTEQTLMLRLKETNTQLHDAEAKKTKLSKELQQLSKDSAAYKATSEKELEQASHALATAKQQLAEREQEIGSVSEELENVKQQLDNELEAKSQELDSKQAELKRLKEECTAMISRLETTEAARQKEAARLKDVWLESQAETMSLKELLASLEERIQSGEANSERESLEHQQTVASLNEQKLALEQRLQQTEDQHAAELARITSRAEGLQRELDEMTCRCQDAEASKQQVESQCEKLSAEIKSVQTAASLGKGALESRCASLLEEVYQRDAELGKLQTALQNSRKELREREKEWQAKLESLQTSLQQASDTQEAKDKECEDLRKERKDLEQQLKQQILQRQEAEELCGELQRSVEESGRESEQQETASLLQLREADEKRAELQQLLDLKEQDIARLENDYSTLQQSMERERQKVDSQCKETVADMSRLQKEFQEFKNATRSQIEVKESENEVMRRSLQERDATIQELQATVDSLENKVDESFRLEKTVEDKNFELRAELDQAYSSMSEFQQKLLDLQGKIVKVDEELVASKNKRRDLQRKLDTTEKANEALHAELASSREALQSSQKALADQKSECVALRNEFETTQQRVESSSGDLKMRDEKCAFLEGERNKWQAKWNEAATLIENTQERNVNLEHKLQTALKELEVTGSKLTVSQQQLARLEEEVTSADKKAGLISEESKKELHVALKREEELERQLAGVEETLCTNEDEFTQKIDQLEQIHIQKEQDFMAELAKVQELASKNEKRLQQEIENIYEASSKKRQYLEEELANATEKVSQLERELSKAVTSLQEDSKQLTQAREEGKRLEYLEEKLRSLKEKVMQKEGLERQLMQAQEETVRMRERYQQQRGKLEGLDAELVQMRCQLSEAQDEARNSKEARQKVTALKSTIGKYTKHLDEFERRETQYNDVIDKFKAQDRRNKELIAALEKKLDEGEERLSGHEARAQQLDVEVTALRQQLSETERHAKAQGAEIRSLNTQLDYANRQLRDKNNQSEDSSSSRGSSQWRRAVSASAVGPPTSTEERRLSRQHRSLRQVTTETNTAVTTTTRLTRLSTASSASSLPEEDSPDLRLDDLRGDPFKAPAPLAPTTRQRNMSSTSSSSSLYETCAPLAKTGRLSADRLTRSSTNSASFNPTRAPTLPCGMGALFSQDDEPDFPSAEFGRLSEMQRRNTLCLPHMKSSYPVETQVAPTDGLGELKIQRGTPVEQMETPEPYALRSRGKKRQSTDSLESRSSLEGNAKRPAKEARLNGILLGTPGVRLYKQYSPRTRQLLTHKDRNTPGRKFSTENLQMALEEAAQEDVFTSPRTVRSASSASSALNQPQQQQQQSRDITSASMTSLRGTRGQTPSRKRESAGSRLRRWAKQTTKSSSDENEGSEGGKSLKKSMTFSISVTPKKKFSRLVLKDLPSGKKSKSKILKWFRRSRYPISTKCSDHAKESSSKK